MHLQTGLEQVWRPINSFLTWWTKSSRYVVIPCDVCTDCIQYGYCTIRYGKIRSAAADWSRFPLGTRFRLVSDPDILYVVDDYGSALVGKETIDLYKPTMSSMRKWGMRHVEIEIVKWGCLIESLRILKPRATKARHVRRMVWAIQKRINALGNLNS